MLPSPRAQSTAPQGLFHIPPSVTVLLFRAGPCLEQLQFPIRVTKRPGIAPGWAARLTAEERAQEMRTPQPLRSDQEGNPTWGLQKCKRRLDAEFSMTQTLNNYSFASQFRLAKNVTNGKQAHSSIKPIYKQHNRPPIPALAWRGARHFPVASEPCPVEEPRGPARDELALPAPAGAVLAAAVPRCRGTSPCPSPELTSPRPRARGCHAASPCRARRAFGEPKPKRNAASRLNSLG